MGTAQTLIIDEKVLGVVERCGYTSDYVKKRLNNDELDYCTCLYYLLCTAGKEY